MTCSRRRPRRRTVASSTAATLAQIVYTSGTESRPKGAMLTHEALIWQYVSCIVDGEIAADDVMLHALPLYHCAQLDVLPRRRRLPRRDQHHPARARPGRDPARDRASTAITLVLRAADGVDRAAALTAASTPPTCRRCARATTARRSCRSRCCSELQRRLPDVRLWNFYGQTEMAPLATILGPGGAAAQGRLGRPRRCSTSRPGSSTTHDATVPPGEVGEIVHRSPHATARATTTTTEKTAEAFRGGWFHTGDLGDRRRRGYLTVVDRKKDMIKTGGENVASREVEEAIYQLAGVSEVAVFGLPHPHWIEAVTAVVVGKAGHALDEGQVIAHCRARLAGFKVPKRVVFVDALPKNPSGKMLKRELRATLATTAGPAAR